jgi:hypothetical protein
MCESKHSVVERIACTVDKLLEHGSYSIIQSADFVVIAEPV